MEELEKEHGVTPEQCKSVTFIASRLQDNKVLMESDPGYIAATPPPDTPPAEGGVKKHGLRIAKSDDERMLAFGWASVAIRVDGEQIEDWQEDMIDPADLENAAYRFVELYRSLTFHARYM